MWPFQRACGIWFRQGPPDRLALEAGSVTASPRAFPEGFASSHDYLPCPRWPTRCNGLAFERPRLDMIIRNESDKHLRRIIHNTSYDGLVTWIWQTTLRCLAHVSANANNIARNQSVNHPSFDKCLRWTCYAWLQKSLNASSLSLMSA